MENKINKKWFIQAINDAGFKTMMQFADAVDLDSIKLSNILSGKRKLKHKEIKKFSEVLYKNITEIRIALGEDASDYYEYFLNGFLNEHDSIELCRLDRKIKLPFTLYAGNLIEVNTNSYQPFLNHGDIIGYRFQNISNDYNSYINRIMIVGLINGGIVLKKFFPTNLNNDLCTLMSLSVNTPPIINSKILWAAPIDFIIPNSNH